MIASLSLILVEVDTLLRLDNWFRTIFKDFRDALFEIRNQHFAILLPAPFGLRRGVGRTTALGARTSRVLSATGTGCGLRGFTRFDATALGRSLFLENPIGLFGMIFGSYSPWTATYFIIFSRED